MVTDHFLSRNTTRIPPPISKGNVSDPATEEVVDLTEPNTFLTGDVKAFPKSVKPLVKSLNFNFFAFAIHMNIFII